MRLRRVSPADVYKRQDRYDLLEQAGFKGATEVELIPEPIEKFAGFLNNQTVSIVLLILGFVGLLVEVITPGFEMCIRDRRLRMQILWQNTML